LKTDKNFTARFLVLLPHRESRRILENFRQKIFSQEFPGAFSFPPVAPLAVISKAFSRDELRELAGEIRKAVIGDGKITAGITDQVHCPDTPGLPPPWGFLGPALDLPPLDSFRMLKNEKVIYVFPKTILCAAVVDNACTIKTFPESMPFSFRAAIITNLAIRPLDYPYSFEWRLGPECWLPAYKRQKPFDSSVT